MSVPSKIHDVQLVQSQLEPPPQKTGSVKGLVVSSWRRQL